MRNEREDEAAVSGHFEMLLGPPDGKYATIYVRMLDDARAGTPWSTDEISGRFARIPCLGEYLTSQGLTDKDNQQLFLRVDLVVHIPHPQLFVTAIPGPIALQYDLTSSAKFYEQSYPSTVPVANPTQP